MTIFESVVVSHLILEFSLIFIVIFNRKKIINTLADFIAQNAYYALRVREEEIIEESQWWNCGHCDCSSDEIH